MVELMVTLFVDVCLLNLVHLVVPGYLVTFPISMLIMDVWTKVKIFALKVKLNPLMSKSSLVVTLTHICKKAKNRLL